MENVKAEYIWLDGQKPTAQLRSKTKILDGAAMGAGPGGAPGKVGDLPDWGFDGSSTEQATGNFSDCLLKPVAFIPDPIRGAPHILVMCEVFNADGTVHATNTRARLRRIAKKFAEEEPWFGVEQEYTMFDGDRPLGFPAGEGFPAPQGPYYCGVGSATMFGRELVEDHLQACLAAGLVISGINAEVMPGQWEFQVGPLGPLEVSDQLWFARWLLHRLSEDYGITITLSPKPVMGDWNGAGCHVNYSTKSMRAAGGIKVIHAACEKLGKKHKEHIAVYGAGNEMRLTGKHETCSINEFRWGVSDRGASIRIPMSTANGKRGYLEDRRPAANMDPYQVTAKLIETTCG
jgi:glutamine synthetase